MDSAPALVMFSALYPPHAGGVETYAQSLARSLVRKGRRTVVVTMALEGDSGVRDEDGVEVVRLPCRPLLDGRWPLPRKDGEARRLWGVLDALPVQGVIVHARFYALSYEGLSFARAHGVRPVLVEHGSAHLTMGNTLLDVCVRQVEHALTARCRRLPADCYGVSSKASAWLRHFGLESSGELPNAIDADAFCARSSGRDFRAELSLGPDDVLVAFVGRLVKEKGVESLAQACAVARGRGARVHVAAAGGGPLEEALRRQRADGFHLVGPLGRPDVAALLRQADALCLPSRSEGFATALLEAAACGTAVITTDVGGARELVPDPSYGTILPDASPATVAAALADAAGRPGELAAQGAKLARLVREECSWDATADRAIAACERAAERRGQRTMR